MDIPGSSAAPTILIVEDDSYTLEILGVVIRRKFAGLTVCTAGNGREGVEIFQRQGADIVVTDVNMPKMGGVEMVQAIRQIKPEVRVIVLTADTGKAALEDSLGKGFQLDHYILKPIAYQNLFQAIERCLAEIGSNPS